jgi:DNA ligase-4
VLVADACEVIRQAKALVLSKNSGNLLQDFIWQTRQFDPNQVSSVKSPVDKDRAKRDGNDALEGLRTLGRLLITNGQFRKLRESRERVCVRLCPEALY